ILGGQQLGNLGAMNLGLYSPVYAGNRYQVPSHFGYLGGPDLSALYQGQGSSRLTYEELQQRRQAVREARAKAQQAARSIAGLNFKEGVNSVATAEGAADAYQYLIDQKVSLPRQKSAMLPIINDDVEGTRVSIFNETVHAKHPLLGLRLKNTS